MLDQWLLPKRHYRRRSQQNLWNCKSFARHSVHRFLYNTHPCVHWTLILLCTQAHVCNLQEKVQECCWWNRRIRAAKHCEPTWYPYWCLARPKCHHDQRSKQPASLALFWIADDWFILAAKVIEVVGDRFFSILIKTSKNRWVLVLQANIKHYGVKSFAFESPRQIKLFNKVNFTLN